MTDHVTAPTPEDVIQAFTRHGFDISWHGALHFAGVGAGFLCLIAACFVIARRASTLASAVGPSTPGPTRAIFVVGFAGVASGASNPAAVLGFLGCRGGRLGLDRRAGGRG